VGWDEIPVKVTLKLRLRAASFGTSLSMQLSDRPFH
jgi:hypothetical protein